METTNFGKRFPHLMLAVTKHQNLVQTQAKVLTVYTQVKGKVKTMLAIMSFDVTMHSFNISQNNTPLHKFVLVKYFTKQYSIT